MKQSRIRVGVIGLGAIAERAHLPGFAACRGARLTAVASSRPRARRSLAARFDIPLGFATFRELIECDEVDAVAICTPNDEHFEMARAALMNEKHVLLEKPITTRVDEAKQLVALARRKRRVLQVHHNLRFQSAAILGRRVLAAGTIGELVAFDAVMGHRGPAAWARHAKWFFDARRVGGGVLMDLGVHAFDLIRYLSSDEPVRIAATLRGATSSEGGTGEHHANCLLSLASGAEGSVNISWREASYRNSYRFLGTRGAVSVDLARGQVTLERNGKIKELSAKTRRAPTAQQAFIRAIGGEPDEIAARGEDGAIALALALAALEAAHASRSTRLRPLSFAR